MSGGDSSDEYSIYKNETIEKLNNVFNDYINRIRSLKVETKDIIYENIFNKENIIEQQNKELLKKIKYVKGLISVFNFSDFDEVVKLNLLFKKRKMEFNNEEEDDEDIKIVDINNEVDKYSQRRSKSKSITLNNYNDQSNNDRSTSSNKGFEDENIEARGTEITTDFEPVILKIREFSKIRLPVLYTKNSIKLVKYFTIKSQLNQNPNYDFSLSSSDVGEKPIEPSMLSTPSEIKNLTDKVISELKFNYPRIDLYLKSNEKAKYELIKIKTLLYSVIEYKEGKDKKPQYYYYYLCKNKEIHKVVEYKYVKLAMIRKYGGKIQNILKSAEKKFKNYIIRKDNEGNTMIKGELQVKYEALIHYFLTGGKSVDEISYIQFEVFLHKSDLYKDVQTNTDTIVISEELRKNYEMLQNDLDTLRANI